MSPSPPLLLPPCLASLGANKILILVKFCRPALVFLSSFRRGVLRHALCHHADRILQIAAQYTYPRCLQRRARPCHGLGYIGPGVTCLTFPLAHLMHTCVVRYGFVPPLPCTRLLSFADAVVRTAVTSRGRLLLWTMLCIDWTQRMIKFHPTWSSR